MINELADRYARAKEAFDAAERELKALKDEIKALGMEKIEGQYCFVTLSLSERRTLDRKLLETKVDKAVLVACEKVSDVETIRVKAKVL